MVQYFFTPAAKNNKAVQYKLLILQGGIKMKIKYILAVLFAAAFMMTGCSTGSRTGSNSTGVNGTTTDGYNTETRTGYG